MPYDPSSVGTTMQQYPLKELLISLAEGIAEAQNRLDLGSIEAASQLIDRKITINDADGNKITKSLLELGFMPNFYHFQSATIRVSVEISMKIEEQTSSSFAVGISVGHSTSTYQDIPTTSGTPPAGGGTQKAGAPAADQQKPADAQGEPTWPNYKKEDLVKKDIPALEKIAADNTVDISTITETGDARKTKIIDAIIAGQGQQPQQPQAPPPVANTVKIGGKVYTLEELKALNIGANETAPNTLRKLGLDSGLITTSNPYTPGNYGTPKERKTKFAQAIFDHAKANPPA